MARALNRPQKALFLAIAVTVALAFMPVGWQRWVGDVAEVIRVPMTPFSHAAEYVAAWLRPPADPRMRVVDGDRERVLLEQRDDFERLYHAADLRARELQEQLEQIQQMPLDDLRMPIRPVVASITGRNPRAPTDMVEINRGRRHGVESGTIVAYGGVHLIGRVADVGALRSYVLPVTNVSSSLVRARVVPRDQPEVAISTMPVIQLEPRGDGSFTAEVEHTWHIVPGDIVRLDDHGWPASAQAMIVGSVDAVRPNDSNSLLKILVIRPRYQIHQVANVTLKIEIDPQLGGASTRQGAGS